MDDIQTALTALKQETADQPRIQRMLDEMLDLSTKTDKLSDFTNTSSFKELSFTKQGLLLSQLGIMASYMAILVLRLDQEEGLDLTRLKSVVTG